MCNLIIFGASGDIAKKKIFPALYEWFNEDQSSLNKIIGYGRTRFSQIEFHQKISANYDLKKEHLDQLFLDKEYTATKLLPDFT